MKPDWQNKSYAKGGAATGPSTMHSKLKVGMSNLHSKIGQANSNMPQAPKPAAKPAVRKFADGGAVRTRSDDEIGDTNPRTGKVDPGSYERRMKAGEENMASLRSAADSIKNFFSQEGKTSSSNVTGDTGMSASDTAKKSAMSGGAQMPAAAEEKPRTIESYMAKAPKDETEAADYGNEGARTPMPRASSAPKAKPAKRNVSAQNVSAPAPKTEVKMSGSPDMPASDVRPEVKPKPVAKPQAPAGETYRTLGGKIARTTPKVEKPLDQQWGMHNVVPNAKYYAGKVSDYFGSLESPSQRRARLNKEGK